MFIAQKWLQSLILLLISVCSCSLGSAQTISTEQNKLSAYQQQLVALQALQQQLQINLELKQAELLPLQRQKTPEDDDRENIRSQLNQAQANYNGQPTDDNKARLKNEQFKMALAQRKYKKSHQQQFELEQQVEALEQELTGTIKQIDLLKPLINEQSDKLEQLKLRVQAYLQSQRIREQRLKTEAAEAEIVQLKAKLLQQQKLQVQQQNAQQQLERQRANQSILANTSAEPRVEQDSLSTTVVPTTPTANIYQADK